MNKLYELYGDSALKDNLVGGEHAVWTTDNVKDIVKYAKERGWTGVFTWLVTHDFPKSIPDKYSRQKALSDAVEEIWEKE